MSTIAPFGSWASPVAASDTVSGIVRFSDIQYDDGSLYWLEMRPSEGGRTALVQRSADGDITEVLPDTVSVRTMAHEYGGGAYLAVGSAVLYADSDDQRLYRGGRELGSGAADGRTGKVAFRTVCGRGAHGGRDATRCS